jgi:uncharacterized protein (TIGR03086 family)
MFDLEPATRALAELIDGVRDDQLTALTPCPGMSVGTMLDHADGFALAFTAAAQHTTPPGGSRAPSPDASRLSPEWRIRIPARLAALADAWRAQDAWTGITQAGGQELPSEIAGVIALDEVAVHGWDIAVATGQSYTVEPQLLEVVHGFVHSMAEQYVDGTPGMFGPPIAVPDDAPLLDRVIGLAGRDPGWNPK